MTVKFGPSLNLQNMLWPISTDSGEKLGSSFLTEYVVFSLWYNDFSVILAT
jgi:hypothetical protein